jgi:hypothetical protein
MIPVSTESRRVQLDSGASRRATRVDPGGGYDPGKIRDSNSHRQHSSPKNKAKEAC